MTCVYCQSDLTKLLSGEFCYRRIGTQGNAKLHSPWIIEPLTPTERVY